MIKKSIVLLTALMSLQSFARNYVDGDGGLDFTCSDKNVNATPYNTFKFQMFYDSEADIGLGNFDDVLKSGDGTVVYQVSVAQAPSFGAEATQNVVMSGCSRAPLKMIPAEESLSSEIFFECDGDGDAGYGQIFMDLENDKVEGEIKFPNGKLNLQYPIEDETTIEMKCEF